MCSINPGSAQLDSQKLKVLFLLANFFFEREGRKTGEIRVVVLIFLRFLLLLLKSEWIFFDICWDLEIEKGLLNFLRGSSENHKGQLSIFLEGEGEGGGACLSHIGCRYEIILHVCRAIFLSRFCRASAWFYRIGFCYFSVVFFLFQNNKAGWRLWPSSLGKEQHVWPDPAELSLYVVCACCFRENMITIFGGPKTKRTIYKWGEWFSIIFF